MALKDIAKSGMLGVGPALVADNPNLLRGMGLIGNIAANKLDDREERKRRDAEMAAAGVQPQGAAPMPMKKGGKVSSASKRADGIAIRGKTRA